MSDWLRELFRFGDAVEIPVADTAAATVATDEQTSAILLRLTGNTTNSRAVTLQPRKAGAHWAVKNETIKPVTVSMPSGTGVMVTAGKAATMVYDGTNIVRIGSDSLDYSIPSTGWSWVNQGTSTLDTNGEGSLFLAGQTAAGDNVRAYVRALPSATPKVTAAFRVHLDPVATCDVHAGLCWRDSASGKLVLCGIARTAGGIAGTIINYKMTSPTAYSAAYTPARGDATTPADVYWLKMLDDGADRLLQVSVDNRHYYTIHTVGRTDFLTANQFGFYVDCVGSKVGAIQLLHWYEQ